MEKYYSEYESDDADNRPCPLKLLYLTVQYQPVGHLLIYCNHLSTGRELHHGYILEPGIQFVP